MRICLISTLLNEAQSLPEWIDSLEAQKRPPDEIVIVDGGSTDGSWELLEGWAAGHPEVRLISLPSANISKGRNAAIRAATSEVVAVTDAGCTLDPHWLEHLARAMKSGAEVAMGFYEPDSRSALHRFIACLNLPDASEVDPERFMPSSRSIAFSKAVWEQAGGYPEWLDIGEDMYFNFAVLALGARRDFAPEAIVRWHLRATLRATARQYFRYAEGDGLAGMYTRRHALRFATYGAALAAGLFLRPRRFVPTALAATALRMRPAYRRARRRLEPGELAAAVVCLPALEALLDAAKMAGYVSGVRRRSQTGVGTGAEELRR